MTDNKKYNLVIFFLLALQCMLGLNPINLARAQTSTNVISSQGTITYSGEPTGLVLKYSTDFETVTKRDANRLNMGIENWFEFSGSNVGMFIEDGHQRSNSPIPHSGSRAIGMEVISGYRNEFNIMHMENIVGNEYQVSVWLYLPSDWALHLSGFNWYALCDTFMGDQTATPVPYYPYNELYIHQTNVGSATPDFYIDTDIRDNVGSGQYIIPLGVNLQHFPLPRGEWFNLKYYVYRHVSNGIIKIWIDDTLIVNASGVKTKNANSDAFFTTIAKIYYDQGDTYSGYKLWVDDLSIYGAP